MDVFLILSINISETLALIFWVLGGWHSPHIKDNFLCTSPIIGLICRLFYLFFMFNSPILIITSILYVISNMRGTSSHSIPTIKFFYFIMNCPLKMTVTHEKRGAALAQSSLSIYAVCTKRTVITDHSLYIQYSYENSYLAHEKLLVQSSELGASSKRAPTRRSYYNTIAGNAILFYIGIYAVNCSDF